MLDISGQSFDNLTVIRLTDKRNSRGQVIWELLCECGDTCEASATDLKRGLRGFCKKCRKVKSSISHYKSLYGNYKRLAESRGYSFEISLEYFIHLTKLDCCKFCNSAKLDSDASYLMEWLGRVAERRFMKERRSCKE